MRLGSRGTAMGKSAQAKPPILSAGYFAKLSREDEFQVHPYSRNAFVSKSEAFLEDTPAVRKLMKEERIERLVEKNQNSTLTDIGKMVALGALDIYPELERFHTRPGRFTPSSNPIRSESVREIAEYPTESSVR